jgi:hypothetical protein
MLEKRQGGKSRALVNVNLDQSLVKSFFVFAFPVQREESFSPEIVAGYETVSSMSYYYG